MSQRPSAANPRFALFSVTDKTGVVEFAKVLATGGWKLLSTGGTARLLREAGLEVRDVADFTGSPEVFDGRVKTLHPKVHGGVLYDRDVPAHLSDAQKIGVLPIDFVVVNLYDFANEAKSKNLSAADAIHHIDIGGPAMLRAAAKNHRHCLPLIDPTDYPKVARYVVDGMEIPSEVRLELAAKTFKRISAYDQMIGDYLSASQPSSANQAALMPAPLSTGYEVLQTLRYGENPHQRAALLAPKGERRGFAAIRVLQGKELSYNNFLDLDAAALLVADCPAPAVAIIKHTNPCGAAMARGASVAELFGRALKADEKSAFGGIVAVNQPVDEAAAQAFSSIFLECIVAPQFAPEAVAILQSKKNLRLVELPELGLGHQPKLGETYRCRTIAGAMLLQDDDRSSVEPAAWQTVTQRKPTKSEETDLVFAEIVCKHVKSNAIVYVRDGKTLAVGAGQMSRIDSARFAAQKAREQGVTLKGAVVASDAFFPFRDTVDLLAAEGVVAIVQPGGSVRDEESIVAADAAHIAMVFTGKRHFRH